MEELDEILQPLKRAPSRLRGAVSGNYRNPLPEYDGGFGETMAWRKKREQIRAKIRRGKK